MSEVMDRIRRGSKEQTRIEVPEWGAEDEPFVIYARPWTLKDSAAIAHVSDGPQSFVEILIRKAMTEGGDPVFNREDKLDLMACGSASVVMRVAMAIHDHATVEDHLGN